MPNIDGSPIGETGATTDSTDTADGEQSDVLEPSVDSAFPSGPNANIPLTITVQPPQSQKRPGRAINPDLLTIEVVVNGNGVLMTRNSDGGFTGETVIPSGRESTIVVTWAGPGGVILSQADKTFNVRAGATSFGPTITDDDYDKSFDDDDDGRTNIAELDDGTDPLDAQDPGIPVIEVALAVRLELPQALSRASAAVRSNVFAEATVNRAPIILNRSGSVWSGETTVPENSEVTVSATFYPTSDRPYRLATLQRNQRIGTGGTTVQFRAADYDTENFDQDSDGLTNIEEVAQGSDPTDDNDPPQNPCDVSNFAAGCDVDSDNDGKPDSEEGAAANSDTDSIPDYLDSATTDSDDDGVVNEMDNANNNPCVPSQNNEACNPPTTGGGTTDSTTGDTTGGTTSGTTGGTSGTTGGTSGTTTGGTIGRYHRFHDWRYDR